MKAYLSIDLDYWSHSTERSALHFFDRVFALNMPIWVAPFHDQLLPHIEQSDCNTLINVDFHSDLAELALPAKDMLVGGLNEGTWGNYVSWKDKGKFIWRYPDHNRIRDGYCHEYPGYDPFKNPCYAGWRATSMLQGLSSLPWRSIRAVGVCLSAYWLRGAPIQKITDRLQISQWRKLPERLHRRSLHPFLWVAA
jgi:hypothetical protein